MRTRKTKGRRGSTATGGSRQVARRDEINDWRAAAPYEPEPAVLALLRATWGRRDRLADYERTRIWSFLRWIEQKALTPAQLESAKRIGASVGVGFDDPTLDAPEPTTKPVQPWGPLPLRPPGR
jgi:hypothetical protein